MFPNAWFRMLTEAGINDRTNKKLSSALRISMMDGQRAIWKIRNDMKHNKPVQEREASRIDKAFRVMNLLKINKFDDSPTSVKMKTAKQRRDWLKRQYNRAGRVLLQRHEDDKKEKTRQKHAQQISSNNAAVAQVLKSNTKQPSIMQALNPIAKRKREDTKSSHPTTPAKPTTTESPSIRPQQEHQNQDPEENKPAPQTPSPKWTAT